MADSIPEHNPNQCFCKSLAICLSNWLRCSETSHSIASNQMHFVTIKAWVVACKEPIDLLWSRVWDHSSHHFLDFGHILVNFGRKINADSVLETRESCSHAYSIGIAVSNGRFSWLPLVLGWNPKRDVYFLLAFCLCQKSMSFLNKTKKLYWFLFRTEGVCRR